MNREESADPMIREVLVTLYSLYQSSIQNETSKKNSSTSSPKKNRHTAANIGTQSSTSKVSNTKRRSQKRKVQEIESHPSFHQFQLRLQPPRRTKNIPSNFMYHMSYFSAGKSPICFTNGWASHFPTHSTYVTGNFNDVPQRVGNRQFQVPDNVIVQPTNYSTTVDDASSANQAVEAAHADINMNVIDALDECDKTKPIAKHQPTCLPRFAASYAREKSAVNGALSHCFLKDTA